MKITELFVKTGLCKSNKEAKRLISSGGARINDMPITDCDLVVTNFEDRLVIGKFVSEFFEVHPCSIKGK